jgi:hypothetical protein
MGSISLPKSVTIFLLFAIRPSRKSDKAANIKIARLKTLAHSPWQNRKNIKIKVSTILSMVNLFAIFI